MSKQSLSWRIEGSFREDLNVLGLSTLGISLRQKIGAQGAIQHFCFDFHLFYIPIKGYMMPPPIHSWYIGFKPSWITLLILMEASSTCLPQKCFSVCTAVTAVPPGIHPPECLLWALRKKNLPTQQCLHRASCPRSPGGDSGDTMSWFAPAYRGNGAGTALHLKSQPFKRTEAVMPSHLICRDADKCIAQFS